MTPGVADGPGPAGAAVPVRRVVVASYAGFTLVGWSMLLVPVLIRDLKVEFGQADAGFALLYFLAWLLFASGAFLSGVLAGRLGRRRILTAAALLLAAGLLTQALAPSWAVFLVGVALAGAGAGTIDAGVNGVIMDLASAGRGSALSMLHLFYSVGALTAPLVVGAVIGAGIDWRVPVLATALVAAFLALPIGAAGRVPPRGRATAAGPAGTSGGGMPPSLRLPLLALAVAIGCYVATEAGVSSWLVAFLVEEPLGSATQALGLFLTGLAAGRLTSARIADRFAPVPFTVACILLGAAGLLGGIVAPPGAFRIAVLSVAGFGFGPVYPMIMSVAGAYYPHRAAAVSGALTAAAVAGSVVYPPFMGLLSDVSTLGAGMLGAVILAVVGALAILVAGRTATRAHLVAAGGPTPAESGDPEPDVA